MSDAEVCLLNIGPRQRRLRFHFGLLWAGVGIALAVTLLLLGVGREVRLVVAGPFVLSAYGFFQARDKV